MYVPGSEPVRYQGILEGDILAQCPYLPEVTVADHALRGIFGILTKPFALMIRLFANIMAGHTIILALTCLIFITASMGTAINGTMTIVSVLFTVFMNCLELLVACLQAYIFTLLSANYIGLAKVRE